MSCIVQEGDHLLLNKELVWTDVAAFRAAVEHARRTAASGKTKDAFTACERATRFYGGDFLPNETCEDWTIPVREQLRRLFTETLDRAAELSESLGEKERSRALYEQMFSHDACHDHACRWLMEQYAAEGKRYAAITVYERHELAVRKELDIEPDEQTKKIYRSIIGG
jgi:DNA-binding SARP family transcriptional activator